MEPFVRALLLLTVAFFSSLCLAGEPIPDKDKFEAQYVKCIESGLLKGCWSSVFAGHFVPWAKKETELLSSAEAGYTHWLDGQSVYKVHRGIKELKGEVFDNRSYVIERDDGNVVGLWVGLRQVKGKWYVGEIVGVSSDEFLRNILNMTDPRAK